MSDYNKASPKATAIFANRNVGNSLDMMKILQYEGAKLWDIIDSFPTPDRPEAMRLAAVAKTHLETAIMFAVKALSRQAPDA
jgi:hypothetical protein